MFLLLGTLSVLSNYLTIPLFFGVDFVLSSIINFLLIHLFAGWGMVIAVVANLHAVFWIEYDGLIYTLEVLVIGLTWKRYSYNLLIIDVVFWGIGGLPSALAIYTWLIPLDASQMTLVLLKTLVNGIANTSIACLLITFLPLSSWGGQPNNFHRPTLRQIFLNLITICILLSALITMVINGWLIVDKIIAEIKTDLQQLTKNITTDFRLRHQQHLNAIKWLAQVAMQTPLQDSPLLAQTSYRLFRLFPEFMEVAVINRQGQMLFNYHNSSSQFTDIYSPTEHQALIQAASHQPQQILTVNTFIAHHGLNVPIMAYVMAIKHAGKVIGNLIVYFKLLETLYKVHTIDTITYPAQVTFTDNHGIVLHTTRTDLKLLNPYHSQHVTTWQTTNLYVVFPPTSVHSLWHWRDAIYIQHAPINEQIPLTVVVEMSIQSYWQSWQQLYVNKLEIITFMALLSLFLAILISNWLVVPLLQLTQITDNLPHRLEKRQVIQWPTSKVSEIEALTANYRTMAELLQARFEEIQTAKSSLEQCVQTRTQELLHERTLLCNLIDSIPDLISYKDTQGSYLGCNRAFEEFVGYRETRLIGKTDVDILPTSQAERYRELDQRTLTTCQPQSIEEWVTYPQQRQILFETLKIPFVTPEGKILGLISISRDITQRKQAEEGLRQSQQMLRLVIDNIPQFIFWKDNHSVYLGSNQNFAQIVGVDSPDKLVGKKDSDLLSIHPQTNQRLFTILNRWITADGQYTYQQVESIELADGISLWLEINKIPLRDTHGQIIGVLGSFEDITERKRVEEKLRQSVKVIENSAEAICIADAETRIIAINKAFTKITGYTEKESLGESTKLLKSGKHQLEFYEKMWKSIHTLGYWEGEIWNRRKSGEIYPEWLHISVIRDDIDQKITNYLAIFSDLTLRKQTEQRLIHLAHYDDLTGLPNRTLFYERVTRALYHAQADSHLVAVVFIDLDGFKYVNDTWGHLVGDSLLKEVANRLAESLRKTHTLARLGGDDFALVLEQVSNSQEIELIVKKLLEAMVAPFNLQGHETFMTASIGISVYPNHGKDVDTLLKNADIAMYRAKEKGRNNYQFYTTQMNVRSHQRLLLETKLRHAVERDELVLYYQPQQHLASGNIVGAEVLLRWQDSEKGLILPYTFIPLAEETGLIIPIGEWVLYHTGLQHQFWRNHGQPILRMSVNISSRQFRQENLVTKIKHIIEQTNMDPTLLELELTESILVQETDIARKIFYELKEMGIQLAIDDFGTGYSSLSYLKHFPIDKLKIDQSFVRDIPNDKNDMSITRAIIALAHSLRLTVIAEGVETKEQQAFLKSAKCDEIQGYLIGRPLPEKDFIELLSKF
jgi:diguanylate cyclase (GGDEF)-like protein/PAS domain S-box-containing protein